MAATSRSEKRYVVTKTVKSTGADGKTQTKTVEEETIITSDGPEQRSVVTTLGSKDKEPRRLAPGSVDISSNKLKTTQDSHHFPTVKARPDEGLSARLSALTVGSKSGPEKDVHSSTPKKVSLEEFRKQALAKHNQYRAKHGAAKLVLSDKLCTYAQSWADQMGHSGKFCHRPDNQYGENIFYAMNSAGVSGEDVVTNWYNEIKKYDFNKRGVQPGTGHFTQVVWKGSRDVGIGMSEPKPGHYYVVANYDPPGNMMGDFAANVSPPR